MNERPWRLEVWEINPDSIELEWRLWTTYVTEENATSRRDKLVGKGHRVRIVNVDNGITLEKKPKKCVLCGELHRGPYDGTCLL